VHRDLKPENVYLETRPGNPEFVKILDFGIAKVMRGDSIDPQSPQLTATGQTLGTLEYMSPEQLMGKQLDGRSDVYALGVVAYEMITGRLPFPDAKGPAGLITAQLKQTPMPPSQANHKATLPKAADRAILKCLEKDKNSRYPDVSALAAALQAVMADQSSELAAFKQMQVPAGANRQPPPPADMLETRRGELPDMAPPPPLPPTPGMPGDRSSGIAPMGARMAPGLAPQQPPVMTPPGGSPFAHKPIPSTPTPYPLGRGGPALHGGAPQPIAMYPPEPRVPAAAAAAPRSSKKIVWWVIALLAIGAGVGTTMALLFGK
jgi:serine/threonine-protein kinase